VKNKDYLAIQSCDGAITVYEHSKLSCVCQLSDFLLPSPIAYHRVLDGIILQNSSMEIEFYNYSSLVSHANSQKEGKKLIPEWAVNIGEQALEIEIFPRNAAILDIVVLTENMLFVLSQKGSIINQKQFDYLPANICFYDKGTGSMLSSEDPREKTSMNYMISTFFNHVLVYGDMQVVWAARYTYTPPSSHQRVT
jgi:Bardet-Biedl syndrome 9 protein